MSKPIIVAGGGLVWNEHNELLMIYRMDKWDLPKGKLDPGESIEQCALREVQEETGLTTARINYFVGITQHDYFDKYIGVDAIKESHWYAMTALSSDLLIPQTEESITKIEWVKEKDIKKYLENSYFNIEIIIDLYFNNRL